MKKNKNINTKLLIIGIIAALVGVLSMPLSFLGTYLYFLPSILLPCALIICIICFGINAAMAIKNHIKAVKSGKKKKLNLCFKILWPLGCLVDFLVVGLITDWDFPIAVAFGIIVGLIIPCFLAHCLYFAPYLVANQKSHPQEKAIFVLNLFAGWTILAWIIALVWSCTTAKQNIVVPQKTQLSSADELKKFKDLLDDGVITEEEFDAKKKELLGL